MWLFRHSMQHHHPALAFRGIWLRGSSHGSGLPSCTEVDFCRCPDIAPRKNKVVCFFLETRNNLQRLIYRNNLIVCIQAAVIIVIDIHVHLKQYPSKWNCLAGGATKRSILLTASHPALSCNQGNLLKSLSPLLEPLFCHCKHLHCLYWCLHYIHCVQVKCWLQTDTGFCSSGSDAQKQLHNWEICKVHSNTSWNNWGEKSKSQSIFFRLENNLKPRYLKVIMIHWSRTSLMLLG